MRLRLDKGQVCPGPSVLILASPHFSCDSAASLARISHQRTAAAPIMPTSPAFRSKNVLDVLPSTPATIFLRAPCSRGHLRRLAAISGEKCGLVAQPRRFPELSELHRARRATPQTLPCPPFGSVISLNAISGRHLSQGRAAMSVTLGV